MQDGKRRHKISIEVSNNVKTGSGAISKTWSNFDSVWASIEQLKGYEKQSASASWPGSDYKICFRYINGILPTMRIIYNNKVYSILGINNIDERNRELELYCQQGVKGV